MANPPPPRVLSPDEVELLKKYRDLAMPAARMAGLDDFAKWLFTSISVIGSLAAAFSTSAVKSFEAASAWCFFVAIFFTGISLFLAVSLRAVEPGDANWQSLEDMLAKDRRALRWKKGLAAASGGAFALAILAAGSAPIAPRLFTKAPASSLTYGFGKDGVKASARFASTSAIVSELRIVADEPTKATVVAAERSSAGSDGTVHLDVSGVVPATSTGIRIVIACDATQGAQQEVSIPLQQPRGGGKEIEKAMTGLCVK